jgi:hypothetical protein
MGMKGSGDAVPGLGKEGGMGGVGGILGGGVMAFSVCTVPPAEVTVENCTVGLPGLEFRGVSCVVPAIGVGMCQCIRSAVACTLMAVPIAGLKGMFDKGVNPLTDGPKLGGNTAGGT